jgi:hypothetical protein
VWGVVATVMMALVTLVLTLSRRENDRPGWLVLTCMAAGAGVPLSVWVEPAGYALAGAGVMSALLYANRGRHLDVEDRSLMLPALSMITASLALWDLPQPWRLIGQVADAVGVTMIAAWIVISFIRLRHTRRQLEEFMRADPQARR